MTAERYASAISCAITNGDESPLLGLVAVGLLLTPPFGLYGAAIASVVAQAIALGVLMHLWNRSGARVRARDLLPRTAGVRVGLETARKTLGWRCADDF